MNNAMNSYMLQIVLELLDRKKVSVKDLATELELSTRTVLRYIDAISAAGVPIVTRRGRGGGVSISENYRIGSMFFTEEEMAGLESALRLMKANSTDDIADKIMKKLGALDVKRPTRLLSSERIVVEGGVWGDLKRYRGKAEVIERCMDEHKVLEISYRDRHLVDSVRCIEPHSFVLKDGIWYVHAYCKLREEFRLFKISRIVKMATKDEVFEPKTPPTEGGYTLEFPDGASEIDILLRVMPDVRAEVEDWLGAECVTRTASGEYMAKATVADLPELRGKLLSFLGGVEILAPESLHNEVKTTLQRALARMNGYI